ncbi:MAG: hypothetical protein ABEL76_09255 [Bradymonadaceae bacterium]
MTSTPTTIRRAAGLLLALALIASACGRQRRAPLQSLEGPTGVAAGELPDCEQGADVYDRFRRPGGKCPIGLIANAASSRIAVADLAGGRAKLMDLEPATPGVNHLPVGEHPTDIAMAPDARTAYTLNSVGGTISVVDVPRLRVADRQLEPPGSMKRLAVRPTADGGHSLIVATQSPNRLWLRPGIECPAPGKSGGCSGFDAEAQSIQLPGRIADLAVAPHGDRLYAVYSDRNYLSTIALPADEGDRFEYDGTDRTCRDAGASPPCEVARVGLTTGCRDGLDNDGDGAVDRADLQCYEPKGGESLDGIARTSAGACADGKDNDGDGNADRADPDCLRPGSGSETTPFVPDRDPPACSDGEDNDGDGRTDAPTDPDCYGSVGQSESDRTASGFQSVGLDRLGRFAYVTDRRRNQILTVDPARQTLIDAGRSTTPDSAPFGAGLGISVGRHATDVRGVLERRVVWTDPENASRGIVRYDYGALATSDNGRVYVVDTLTSYCQLEESGALLESGEFEVGSERFAKARERECLTVPALPAEKSSDGPCAKLERCRTCQVGDAPDGTDCTSACEELEKTRKACHTEGRRLDDELDAVDRIVVNPQFTVRDGLGRRRAQTAGPGRCNEPASFRRAMDEAQQSLKEPVSLGCDSPLRPQPLVRRALPDGNEPTPLEPLERADLLTGYDLRLQAGEDGEPTESISTSVPDWRVRSETWTVSYEGTLPQSKQSNGLLERDNPKDAQVLVHRGPDLCSTGVRPGDRLVIESDPSGDEACSALQVPDDRGGSDGERTCRQAWLSYEVTEVSPQRLTFEPIESTGENATCQPEAFVDELPSQSCFDTGIEYEIRPEDEWVVHGSESGYVSRRTAVDGECVARFGSQSIRRSSRVETGRAYFGPYLDFHLYAGRDGEDDATGLPPMRNGEAYEYTFEIDGAYSPARIGTGAGLPTDMALVETLESTSRLLMVVDGSGDFVYVRNLDSGRESVLR